MRIALISTPFVSVPPKTYGGTELVVHDLVEGLHRAGHEVTLFATGDSETRAQLQALFETAVWPPDPRSERQHAAFATRVLLSDSARYDLVHAHLPAVLWLGRFLPIPILYTVHHDRDESLAPLYAESDATLVAISRSQRGRQPGLERASVVHHGLDRDRYRFGEGAGGYVAFLGRFAAEKGVHHAIATARAAGIPLRLGGRSHPQDLCYFEREVAPELATGDVTWQGELGGAAKERFLRDAIALLFPIDWEEPFGLVMIEAMLCGTPVVAFDRGAVAEVVEEGKTGFICRNREEMVDRLRWLQQGNFDRQKCRARARLRFGASRMVADYLRLYERACRREEIDVRRNAPTGA